MISVRDVTHGHWLDQEGPSSPSITAGADAGHDCLANAARRIVLDQDARVWQASALLRRDSSVTGSERRQFIGIVRRVVTAPDDMHVGTN